MAFCGLEFTFDGVGCDEYNLKIFSIDGKGNDTFSGGATISLHTDKVSNGYKFNLLGTSEDEPLSFTLSFGTTEYMSRREISKIQRWLFGHKQYKKLCILQEDMSEVYYNCILTDSEIQTLANMPVLITCKVICDSPFAWEYPRTYSYTTASFTHTNTSDINDYVYPKIEFTASATTVIIKNITNDNRETKFTGLQVGEIITLDNEHQIITSSTGLRRLGNFNKNWFELLPNINTITATGVSSVKITYANAKRIGG